MENFKKYFIALDFSNEVLDEAERLQEQLANKKLFSGNFKERENLHLTLKFLGELSEEKLTAVRDLLRQIEQNPFEVKTGNLSYFSSRKISIIWLKILGKELISLRNKIEDSLLKILSKQEKFTPHITLVKVHVLKNKELFLQEFEKITSHQISCKITSFYLIESEKKNFGYDYKVIEKFNLLDRI